MGKMYKCDTDDVAIVDGKLVNVTVTDNFTSVNGTTKEKRTIEKASFTLDGMPVADLVQFLWDAFKVKAQARTWKHMSDRDFEALDGDIHDGLQFIPKSERTSSKVAIINSAYQELLGTKTEIGNYFFRSADCTQSFFVSQPSDVVCSCWLCETKNRIPERAHLMSARCGECHALLGLEFDPLQEC